MSDSSYTDFIGTALTEAKATAIAYFAKTASHEQPEQSLQVMQDACSAIGQQLVARVQAEYPAHNIIEESAGAINNNGTFTWVINAISGRSNFANGLPHFGILLGLLDGAGPLAGGVMLPNFDELFVAERWKGATCNGNRLVASGETELSRALMSYEIDGHPNDTGFTDREMPVLRDIILHTGNLRTSNSVFDALQVAKGSYGATMSQSARLWDCVAPHILLVESGSTFTDFWGRPADYTNPLTKLETNFSYCAAPAALHTALQTLIQVYAARPQ